ncbi:MAG: GAF domain-containing sensor histidine kinase [Methylovirgula sp.]
MRSVEVTGAHGGAIYSFDPARKAFNLAEAYGLDPDFVAAIREVKIRRPHGLLSEVAERKVPIQIPHIAAARDFPLRGATLAAGLQSALIAPLIGSAELLGVLVIERRESGYFPDNTVALIKTLANQSVLAMSNAKLFEQVQEKNKQLAIANEHKSLFFANMSHELRTPLNAVLGYTELMQDGIYGEVPDRAKQVLLRIQTNGAHLLSLINDVLDISKIEAGELSLSLSDYSLRAVIETVVNATGSLAQAKGLRISTDIAPDLPIGRGDERRLTQVLLNIVSNAIKFTDKGGVMIRAKASGNDFRLAVKDTGPGIAPEDQARIFEAFHQVDSTITKQKGGTGLGLSISKRFIEMHGGVISLTSTLGEGSTFKVQIPVRVDRQMEAA